MPGVPYTFATANSPLPLAELDTNFSTAITLGSTPMVLGNTYTAISGLTSLTVTGNITSTSGYVIETDGGAYSALQANSVTIGNSTTGMYYNGSNAIGIQINNTSVFGFGQSGQFIWESYSIPAPTGDTSKFLRNDGTWAVPAGGSGYSGASLTANQTFSGQNTFTQPVVCTYSGGYSALGMNSIELGNSGTGLFYNGAGAIGFNINNSSAQFGVGTGGSLIWGSYVIPVPSGSTSTYLRNDGTWDDPNGAIINGSNTYYGTNTFDSTSTYIGGNSTSNTMILENNSINFYNSITGNQYNSIYYTASSTALSDQKYVVNFNNSGSGQTAFIFAGDGGAYKTGGGTWGSVSDSRLKTNVKPLENALSVIEDLNPVTYTWLIPSENEPTVGFIAQEVQNILPNAVLSHVPTADEKKYISDRTFTINWQNDMIAYLVGAIKELNTLVTEQATEIATLKAKVGV